MATILSNINNRAYTDDSKKIHSEYEVKIQDEDLQPKSILKRVNHKKNHSISLSNLFSNAVPVTTSSLNIAPKHKKNNSLSLKKEVTWNPDLPPDDNQKTSTKQKTTQLISCSEVTNGKLVSIIKANAGHKELRLAGHGWGIKLHEGSQHLDVSLKNATSSSMDMLTKLIAQKCEIRTLFISEPKYANKEWRLITSLAPGIKEIDVVGNGWIVKQKKGSKHLDVSLIMTNEEQKQASIEMMKNLSDKIRKIKITDPEITNTKLQEIIELCPNIEEINFIDSIGIQSRKVKIDNGQIVSSEKGKPVELMPIKEISNPSIGEMILENYALVIKQHEDLQNLDVSLKMTCDDKEEQPSEPKRRKSIVEQRNAQQTTVPQEQVLRNLADQRRIPLQFLRNLLAKDYKIQKLDFSDPLIRDNELNEVASILSGVKELLLTKCSEITGKGRLRAISACKELLSLNLSGARNLTDEELILLAPYLKNLKTLDISNCPLISDEGVKAIASHCANLQNLDLSGCSYTKSGLDALVPLKKLNLNLYNGQSNFHASSFSLGRHDIQVNY